MSSQHSFTVVYVKSRSRKKIKIKDVTLAFETAAEAQEWTQLITSHAGSVTSASAGLATHKRGLSDLSSIDPRDQSFMSFGDGDTPRVGALAHEVRATTSTVLEAPHLRTSLLSDLRGFMHSTLTAY